MTRFARARGSKSCNERVLEQPTSWSEMRKELLRESVRKAAEEQIERESQSKPPNIEVTGQQSASSLRSKVSEPVELASFDEDTNNMDLFSSSSNRVVMANVGKKTRNQETPQKKRKDMDDTDQKSQNEDHVSRAIKQCSAGKKADTSSDGPCQKFDVSPQATSKKSVNKMFHHKNNTNQWRPAVDDRKKPAQTEKDEEGSDPLSKISGNFKGYPVPVEDAETLNDAYKILRKEGLTHQQAMERIKPERRRAEKRLARLKSMVCFRCRKVGHKLSDCPSGDVECDVCFKCGSSTHKYQECKKKGAFVNAKCFVCGVTGHLSSQCPDNPHGVYPQGGQCKICGEKSHLVKDCPQNRNKKEIHPGTTEFDDYFDDNKASSKEPKRKKLKKAVQF